MSRIRIRVASRCAHGACRTTVGPAVLKREIIRCLKRYLAREITTCSRPVARPDRRTPPPTRPSERPAISRSLDAVAVSVFATLKCELFDQQPGGRFATRRHAKSAVFDYLETFYDPRRRHSALGHISPADFEAAHSKRCPRKRVNSSSLGPLRRTASRRRGYAWQDQDPGMRAAPGDRSLINGPHLPIARGVDGATPRQPRYTINRSALLTALARQRSAWRELITARTDRTGDPAVQTVVQVSAEREFDVATDQLQHMLNGQQIARRNGDGRPHPSSAPLLFSE